MAEGIGEKIKALRTRRKFTLKDVSENTGLSTGFLSQLERGMTTIGVESLESLAKVFDVDLTYFFTKSIPKSGFVVRGYKRDLYRVESNKFLYTHLSADLSGKAIFPRMIEILPGAKDEELEPYHHEGEEFVFVLEGILTVLLGDQKVDLYPGDSAHYNSEIIHNWGNYTNKNVKIMVVSTPNRFSGEK